MPRVPDLPCASCGSLMFRTKGSLPEGAATCRPCRGWASHGDGPTHGTSRRYREGCKCDVCRRFNTDQQRSYRKMVKARDGISPTQKYRPAANLQCVECGTVVKSFRTSTPTCNDCRSGFYLHADSRFEIFDRDGWVCGICAEDVPRALRHPDPMSASIDHIVPRSRGGNEDHDNLRLAHLVCNIKRGAPELAVA